MALPYISEATAASIKAAQQRLFATSKLLGNTVEIVFWRDTNDDALSDSFGPYEVLVVMNTQKPTTERGQASAFERADGEFRTDDPDFNVRGGDRFTLPSGVSGRVTLAPVDAGAYLRAPFVLGG